MTASPLRVLRVSAVRHHPEPRFTPEARRTRRNTIEPPLRELRVSAVNCAAPTGPATGLSNTLWILMPAGCGQNDTVISADVAAWIALWSPTFVGVTIRRAPPIPYIAAFAIATTTSSIFRIVRPPPTAWLFTSTEKVQNFPSPMSM